MLKPSIGRRVWYWPGVGDSIPSNSSGAGPQAHDAGICYVYSDRCVNLTVAGHDGTMHARTQVQLLQDDDRAPICEAYATWMPYQIKAAEKESSAA